MVHCLFLFWFQQVHVMQLRPISLALPLAEAEHNDGGQASLEEHVDELVHVTALGPLLRSGRLTALPPA